MEDEAHKSCAGNGLQWEWNNDDDSLLIIRTITQNT